MIPDNLHALAAALIRELDADSRAVCKLMRIHLWFMLTSPQSDDAALYEDVLAVDAYMGTGRSNHG